MAEVSLPSVRGIGSDLSSEMAGRTLSLPLSSPSPTCHRRGSERFCSVCINKEIKKKREMIAREIWKLKAEG